MGHYCEEGAVIRTDNECGGDEYFCPEGVGAPIRVVAGEYTVGGTAMTRHANVTCEEGYYW